MKVSKLIELLQKTNLDNDVYIEFVDDAGDCVPTQAFYLNYDDKGDVVMYQTA